MRFQIVYYSKFGNGKRCCEILKGALDDLGNEVAISSVDEVSPTRLPSAKCYIFSFPTQIGNVAKPMRKFLKKAKLPRDSSYAVINTSLNKPVPLEKVAMLIAANYPKRNKINHLNISVVGMQGPMTDGYYESILNFANSLASR